MRRAVCARVFFVIPGPCRLREMVCGLTDSCSRYYSTLVHSHCLLQTGNGDDIKACEWVSLLIISREPGDTGTNQSVRPGEWEVCLYLHFAGSIAVRPRASGSGRVDCHSRGRHGKRCERLMLFTVEVLPHVRFNIGSKPEPYRPSKNESLAC